MTRDTLRGIIIRYGLIMRMSGHVNGMDAGCCIIANGRMRPEVPYKDYVLHVTACDYYSKFLDATGNDAWLQYLVCEYVKAEKLDGHVNGIASSPKNPAVRAAVAAARAEVMAALDERYPVGPSWWRRLLGI